MEEFIENNLKVKAEIKKENIISLRENKNIVIAEINSWEQERNIMSKKKELEERIIIEDNKEGREVQ